MSRSSEFLRDLAQNGHMIDNKYLPTGVNLYKIANNIEAMRMVLRIAVGSVPNHGLTPEQLRAWAESIMEEEEILGFHLMHM